MKKFVRLKCLFEIKRLNTFEHKFGWQLLVGKEQKKIRSGFVGEKRKSSTTKKKFFSKKKKKRLLEKKLNKLKKK